MTNNKMQGEGDRESARRYNRNTEDFVESAEGRARIAEVAASGEAVTAELTEAERKARARARDTDPQVTRDYSKGSESSDFHELEEKIREQLESSLSRAEAFVREQPVTAAGLAFAAGILVSSLIRR